MTDNESVTIGPEGQLDSRARYETIPRCRRRGDDMDELFAVQVSPIAIDSAALGRGRTEGRRLRRKAVA
jgi:hypothetical protein